MQDLDGQPPDRPEAAAGERLRRLRAAGRGHQAPQQHQPPRRDTRHQGGRRRRGRRRPQRRPAAVREKKKKGRSRRRRRTGRRSHTRLPVDRPGSNVARMLHIISARLKQIRFMDYPAASVLFMHAKGTNNNATSTELSSLN